MNPRTDTLRNRNTNFSTDGNRTTADTTRPSAITEEDCGEGEANSPSPTMTPELHIQSICPRATTTIEETFNVMLPESEQTILVRCYKPVKLKVLLSEIQVTVAREDCRLEYYQDGRQYELQAQEQLDEYLRMSPQRPQLCMALQKNKAN